ncbi:MAG: metalloprotease [Alphaproteobacteria bacterium]|nr:MAG: metalloprotease [Alphaproteobacteria bacterium]
MSRTSRRLTRFAAALLVSAGLGGALAGCSTNPATGRQSFTGFMSEEDEVQIGREQHPQITAEFGGVYDDPEITRYVDSIGQFLASTSEMPDLKFTFTVLDSPVVNAFALPGGYVYVTRGLMALANSEAELAGVIGHEIGHVTARHSAQRYSQSMLANIGMLGVAIATGSGALANLAGTGAQLYLQSYSRDQEFEADMLGVRYLSRATYEPQAMSSFLGSLLADSRLEAALAGQPGAADEYNIMATHPRTADRVQRAIAAAGEKPVDDAMIERDIYLDKIDGMLYGDDPKEGFIKGSRFAHPVLKFEFTVPQDFRLRNSSAAVIAQGPNGAGIQFDQAPGAPGGDLVDYLAHDWAGKISLQNLERITVNGMEGATGTARVNTNAGAADLRLVAIRYDPRTVYRFLMLTPRNLTDRLSEELRRTTYSFRKLTDAEARALKPQRIRVVTVGAGDTVESLARRMAIEDHQVERFRVLNGLTDGEAVRPGQRVKLVAE